MVIILSVHAVSQEKLSARLELLRFEDKPKGSPKKTLPLKQDSKYLLKYIAVQ